MSNQKILEAWNKSDTTESLAQVAGTPIIDEDLLRQVGGGMSMPSAGYICTVSGECNGGRSCWWPW